MDAVSANGAVPTTPPHDAHWTDSDMLLVYAPGSSPDQWPEGMAKFLRISLRAEETYPEAVAATPGLLFEDHLEPMLRA